MRKNVNPISGKGGYPINHMVRNGSANSSHRKDKFHIHHKDKMVEFNNNYFNLKPTKENQT